MIDTAYHMFAPVLWKWKAEGRIISTLVNPWPHMSHRHLADLLGYDGVRHMVENWNDDNNETLKRLCGPHGWVYYRTILAQRGMEVTGV